MLEPAQHKFRLKNTAAVTTLMGPDQSAPMSPAPRAAAVPKPPPAGALQRPAQFFDNLTGTAEDTPRHSEPDTPPCSELGFETGVLPAFASSGPSSTDEQGNALAPNQAPPPEPSLADPQPTAQAASSAAPPAADPQLPNPWAAFSEAPNAPRTQHQSGDYRLMAAGTLRNCRVGMWASRRFDDDAQSEKEFLKQWVMALQDHDWGSQRLWREFCRHRSDNTFNPLCHQPAFVRRFLFIYGGQPPYFYTQHQHIALLSPAQEQQILERFAEEYDATHRHRHPAHCHPPRPSWHWPPRPGDPAESDPPEVSIAPQYQAPPDMPDTTQHHGGQWLSQYTLPPGWPQPNAMAWRTTTWRNSTAPRSQSEIWHSATQWNWWSGQWNASWDWNSGDGWSGGWGWF